MPIGSAGMPRPDGDGEGGPRNTREIDRNVNLFFSKMDRQTTRGDSRVSNPSPAKGGLDQSAVSLAGERNPNDVGGGHHGAVGAGRASRADSGEVGPPVVAWGFPVVKPAPGTLVGRPDPNAPDRSGGGGVKLPPRFLLIDPAEAGALKGAAARSAVGPEGAGKTFTVRAVSGGVQRLETQGGKQGWVPVQAGDQLSQGTVLRTDQTTGGSVGFALNEATGLNWNNLQQADSHALWQLNLRK
jgi:hypothetical protein